ncbi:MAG: aldo/keto reductase [Betaproteobacteria bacterium]|nr:aldo/keto reductase [Betaproteobacteria bacterium]
MKPRTDLARRRVLAAGAGAAPAAALALFAHRAGAAEEPLRTRPIPRTGERLPVVGIGTAVIFDFEHDPAKYGERRRVIEALVAGRASLIDTAHSYGRAEDRVGELVADLGVRDKLFLATKFSYAAARAAATASMQASLSRLKTNRVDLMQAWNVGDANYDFGLLREWKRQGLCRYVGMTTSFSRQYDAIAKVLAREKPDFFQVNYSLGDREAGKVLLPAARDAGAAVLVNLPFGRNSLFRKAGGRPLPEFAAEFGARTWAQFFLKFILSHPAVSAVIPGTDKPEYMADNLQAGRGPLPDAALRRRMVQYWDSLG